ncbi:MAG: hypothetical protein H6696_19915 [Deferribacteres bacterium]|nr:hypothetical protein [candidate division KSB1 bacterium]MCB9504197.1 hypothetical protein [Deferribacteres bacterium]
MKNANEAGVAEEALRLLYDFMSELKKEQSAITTMSVAAIKSSKYRQFFLQEKIDAILKVKTSPQFGKSITSLNGQNEENFSELKSLIGKIKIQINKNLELANAQLNDIKLELGKNNQPAFRNRKNFPKFSHISPPEILDIRR